MSKPIALTLDSEAFNAFKQDFQLLLNSTIATMQQKEVEDATITVKFDITLQPSANPNVDAPGSDGERDVTMPLFKHKVTAAMKIKSERTGFVGGPDYELGWDNENHTWCMVPVAESKYADEAQASIFDNNYEYEEAEDESDYDKP